MKLRAEVERGHKARLGLADKFDRHAGNLGPTFESDADWIATCNVEGLIAFANRRIHEEKSWIESTYYDLCDMIEEKKEHLDKLEAELKTLRASERALGAKRKNFEEMVVQQLGIEAGLSSPYRLHHSHSSRRSIHRPHREPFTGPVSGFQRPRLL